MTAPTDLSRLRLGTAPDSWGIWFDKDPHQVSWTRYLDEVARAGYVWTELGPSGFLPQDPEQLRDELGRRGLQICGGTVFAGLHRGKEALEQAIEDFSKEARLLTALGAKHLIHLPEQYTDMHTGAATEPGQLDREQWENLVTGTSQLGRVLHEEFGVELVFHPHVDTHVDTQERIERFLTDTDPEFVNLCLDTGHIAYCDGDNVEIVRRFPERITYVHLKQVDPAVRDRARAEARDAAAARRAREPRQRSLRDHRAGPLPGRAGHPAAHRRPHGRLLRRLRAGSGPPLAVPPTAARARPRLTRRQAPSRLANPSHAPQGRTRT